MTFAALKEQQDKVDALRKGMNDIFDAAGPDVNLAAVPSTLLPAGVKSGDTYAIRDLLTKMNDDLTTEVKELESLKGVERAAIAAAGGREGYGVGGDGASATDPGNRKSIGTMFVESGAYKNLNGRSIGDTANIDVNLKTLMTTSAGWVPETTRSSRVVEFATRPIQVAQLIPSTTTDQTAVTYMEETTFTNNAAEIAEAGTYPESAFAFTEQSVLVRKIAVFLPVTDEQLEDVGRIRDYVDNRLEFQIRQRLDLQIVAGNGTAPNLRGMLNIAGIQTQAKGADPTPDAVYKAMTKVRVTGQANPNLVIMHPTNWQDVRLLRTADGLYIWGNPSDAGPERIWGLNVSTAQAMTLGTAVVADTAYMELATRRGLDVQVSNSHGTFFVEGKQAIRADIRVAFVVYRPAAVCTVTGL